MELKFWILTVTGATVLTFVLIPFLVGVTLISAVIRLLVATIAQVMHQGIIELFTDKGIYCAASGATGPARPNSVFFLVCNRRLSLHAIQRHFENRFVLPVNEESKKYDHLRHRWRTFMGFLFWEKNPNFKLENHIRMYDYTGSGLAIGRNPSEVDLREVTNGLLAKEYAKGHSPWELLLVQDFYYPGKGCKEGGTTVRGSVLVLRMHHALADWLSIVKFLQHLCKTDCDDVRYTITEAKFPHLSRLRTFANYLSLCARLPIKVSSGFVEQHCMEKFSWLPFRRQLRLQNYHTFFSDPIPLHDIKIVRKRFGVSSNAVLNTVITGALVKLLKEKGREIPRNMICAYSKPLPQHPGGLVNHHSADVFLIFPRKKFSAKDRLSEISTIVKSSTLGSGTSVELWFRAKTLMYTVLPLKLIKLISSYALCFPVYITNVPGPNQEMTLVGTSTKIVDIFATLSFPVSYCGFVVTALSNAGRLRIALNVDRDILPEPSDEDENLQSFARCLRTELEELLSC